MKKLSIIAVSVLSIHVLTGCVSTEEKAVTTEKSHSMSAADLQELLVGKTYPFSKGGIYFSSEAEATAIWEGKTEDTSWYAKDDSSFCYTLDLFGGEEECLGLAKTADGNYTQDWNGSKRVIKASDIKDGKTF